MAETEKTCRVAVVGAGYMAREHIRAFQDEPGVTITGIHSRTRARAAALASEFGISVVCDSVPELYDNTHADLVVVAVPELVAHEVSLACFEFPWIMLLEKPAGYNLQDAEVIYAASQIHQSRVFVALNRRFYASTRAAFSDLQHIPGPRFIHVQDQEDQQQALQFGQPQLVVDNWMYANSIHVVDYFRLFGRGRIVKINPVIPWVSEVPWVVAASVEFDSGDTGLYQGIWSGPGPWAVSINTAQKRWEMRPLEQAAFQLAGQRKLEPVTPHQWDQQFKPGLRLQAKMAIKAALGESTELPRIDDALETMRVIHAIFGQ